MKYSLTGTFDLTMNGKINNLEILLLLRHALKPHPHGQ